MSSDTVHFRTFSTDLLIGHRQPTNCIYNEIVHNGFHNLQHWLILLSVTLEMSIDNTDRFRFSSFFILMFHFVTTTLSHQSSLTWFLICIFHLHGVDWETWFVQGSCSSHDISDYSLRLCPRHHISFTPWIGWIG